MVKKTPSLSVCPSPLGKKIIALFLPQPPPGFSGVFARSGRSRRRAEAVVPDGSTPHGGRFFLFYRAAHGNDRETKWCEREAEKKSNRQKDRFSPPQACTPTPFPQQNNPQTEPKTRTTSPPKTRRKSGGEGKQSALLVIGANLFHRHLIRPCIASAPPPTFARTSPAAKQAQQSLRRAVAWRELHTHLSTQSRKVSECFGG